MYEMLAGYPPFYDASALSLYNKILQGSIDFPQQFDFPAKDLVRQALKPNTTERIGS